MSLVSTDHRNYEKEMTEIKKARNRYQVLLDLVSDVLNVKDLNQLRYIALKGRDGLFDKLEQQIEQPEISGMQVSKRRAVELLELPDLDQLDRAAEKAKQHKEQLQYLDLEAGEVVIASGTEETIRDQNSTFATSQNELDFLDALAEAAKALTRLQTESERLGVPLVQFLKNAPPKDAFFNFFKLNDKGEFEINEQIFKDIKSGFQYHIPRRSWR